MRAALSVFRLRLLGLLVFFAAGASALFAAEQARTADSSPPVPFPARGAVETPGADALPPGVFLFTLNADYSGEAQAAPAFALQAGLLPRLQIGAEWGRNAPARWSARALLFRESGALPGAAVEAADFGPDRKQTAAKAALSKQLNLPRIGFFSGTVGAEAPLYPDGAERSAQPFAAVEKRWILLNRDLETAVEWSGGKALIGVQTRFQSGLRAAAAYDFGGRTARIALQYSNDRAVEAVQNLKRLVRKAGTAHD